MMGRLNNRIGTDGWMDGCNFFWCKGMYVAKVVHRGPGGGGWGGNTSGGRDFESVFDYYFSRSLTEVEDRIIINTSISKLWLRQGKPPPPHKIPKGFLTRSFPSQRPCMRYEPEQSRQSISTNPKTWLHGAFKKTAPLHQGRLLRGSLATSVTIFGESA